MKPCSIVILALALIACQPLASAEGAASPPLPAQSAGSPAGPDQTVPPNGILAFARGACAGCHAVEPSWLSPNPEAPTFEDIANRGGLTAETLSAFLRDAHNYPAAMEFRLTPSRAEELSAYILTLRRDDYRPPE